MKTNIEITQEAIKAAQMVNRYMFWITNQVSHDKMIEIYGNLTGEHLWHKLESIRTRNGYNSAADVSFWFELDITNRNILMQYIISSGYKAK